MITIGSQYFRAPAPAPSQWENDIRTAKAHGLDYLRFWLMWNWYAAAEDTFDFSDLERLLDICAARKVKAIMLINLESVPAWLVKKHPEAVYKDAFDRLYRPESVGNTPGGGFPGLCFHHRAVVDHAKRFVEALVRACAGHPAVECWEPHNEPMFEAGRYNGNMYCYCGASIDAFRQWLKKKYGDIAALGNNWRRKYGSFDEVEPPRRRGMYNDWLDWRMFQLESLMGALRWRIDAIRKNDPRHYVMIHTRGGAGITRNLAKEGIDDCRMATMVDKFGTAAFPQCGPEHEYFIAMSAARCAAKGKEFWMAELQAGPYGMGVHRNDAEPVCEFCGSSTMEATIDKKEGVFDPGEVTSERLAMWSWSGVAQGAKGVMYWQYRNESFGLEYGFGLTNLDGTPHRRLEAVRDFSRTIKNHESLFDNAVLPKNEIAIAWDPKNDIVNWTAVGCTDAVKNSIKGIHKALWHADYPVDIVRLDTDVVDDDFSAYKVIYLPFSPLITRPSAEKLKKFVHAGGTLIAEGSSGQFVDDMGVSAVVPGNGLDELFGCRRDDIRTMHHTLIPRLKLAGLTLKTRMHKETLLPLNGARVIGWYTTGEAAVVENRYGTGKTVYFGTNPFLSYAVDSDRALLSWITRIHKNIRRPAFTDKPDVLSRMLLSGDKRILFVLNTTPEAAGVIVTVPLDGSKVPAVKEITDNERVSFRISGGALRLSVKTGPYGTRVYIIG